MASQERLFSLTRKKKFALFTLFSSFGFLYSLKLFNEKDPHRFRLHFMNNFISHTYPVLLGLTVYLSIILIITLEFKLYVISLSQSGINAIIAKS